MGINRLVRDGIIATGLLFNEGCAPGTTPQILKDGVTETSQASKEKRDAQKFLQTIIEIDTRFEILTQDFIPIIENSDMDAGIKDGLKKALQLSVLEIKLWMQNINDPKPDSLSKLQKTASELDQALEALKLHFNSLPDKYNDTKYSKAKNISATILTRRNSRLYADELNSKPPYAIKYTEYLGGNKIE